LMELLVVMAIIGVLAALILAGVATTKRKANQTVCLVNMRQIAAGFILYANDNGLRLPSRAQTTNKWPTLLGAYLNDPRVYAAPGIANYLTQVPAVNPLNNTTNYTNFIMNGYNDLGAYNNESVVVQLNTIPRPSNTLLLGMELLGGNNFYMDFLELNNSDGTLTLDPYDGGADYIFADGSARYMKKPAVLTAPSPGEYDQKMWLMNQSLPIPTPPPS